MTEKTADAPELTESGIRAADGIALWVRRWTPPAGAAPCARCLIVHGRGEHGGRYAEVASTLAAHGVTSIAVDCRGHGKSEGTRGGIRRFEEYLLDLDAAMAEAERDGEDGLPLFALGHSQGGLILIRHCMVRAEEARRRLRGVALSGPFLSLTNRPSPLARLGVSLLSRILPDRRMTSNQGELTRDATLAAIPQSDPHDVAFFTVAWAREILAMQDTVRAEAARFTLPMLLQHGGADSVACPEASRRFHDECASDDKTLRIYPGLLHEIYNELPDDRARAQQDLAAWIVERANGAS